MTAEQKKEQKNRLLKAKVAVVLQDELGRVPKQQEIDQAFLLAISAVQGSSRNALQKKGSEEDRTAGDLLRSRYVHRLRQSLD